MLMIRLRRMGKTKQPTYRLIISEKAKDTQGKYLELLGTYNPRTQPGAVQLNAERIKYWLSKGAQASPTVYNLLVDANVVEGKKVSNSKSNPGKKKTAALATAAKEIKPVEVQTSAPVEAAA